MALLPLELSRESSAPPSMDSPVTAALRLTLAWGLAIPPLLSALGFRSDQHVDTNLQAPSETLVCKACTQLIGCGGGWGRPWAACGTLPHPGQCGPTVTSFQSPVPVFPEASSTPPTIVQGFL